MAGKDTLKQMYNDQPGATWTTTASYSPSFNGAILRNIHISNGNSTPKYVSIVIDTAASGTPTLTGTKHIYWQVPIAANSVHDLNCNIFLKSTDYLRFFAETTGVVITASGVEVAI